MDWDATYRSEAPSLLRYAQRLVGPDQATDIIQDCFIRAMRAGRRPEGSEQIRPWLYRIVTNLAVDVLRRRRRWRFAPLGSVTATSNARSGEVELVRAALQEIPSEQAVTLVLRLHERMSRAEIASVLGISESAVKARLVRGRLNFVAAYRRLQRLD
jgi:RNA polymerase sigma-70 factor (ECF subfamily)